MCRELCPLVGRVARRLLAAAALLSSLAIDGLGQDQPADRGEPPLKPRAAVSPKLKSLLDEARNLGVAVTSKLDESQRLREQAIQVSNELAASKRQSLAPPSPGADNSAYLRAQQEKERRERQLERQATDLSTQAEERLKESQAHQRALDQLLVEHPDLREQLSRPSRPMSGVADNDGPVRNGLREADKQGGDKFDGSKPRPAKALVPGPHLPNDPLPDRRQRSSLQPDHQQLVADGRQRGFDEEHEQAQQQKREAEEAQERARLRQAEEEDARARREQEQREFQIKQESIALEAEFRDLTGEDSRLTSEQATLLALLEDLERRIHAHNEQKAFVDTTNEAAVHAFNARRDQLNRERSDLQSRCRDFDARLARMSDRMRQYNERRQAFIRKWENPSQP